MRITKNLIPMIDVLFTFLLVFVVITMLIKAKSDNEDSSYKQENALYLISLMWQGNADIDLWARDSFSHIVGFPRREGGDGSLMSLNRDCLGASTTEINEFGEPVAKINEEIITIRGITQGEYIVNAHSYALKDAGSTKVSVKLVKNKPYKIIVEKDFMFETTGEEHTFFRFTLNKDGEVIDINDLPTNLIGSQH